MEKLKNYIVFLSNRIDDNRSPDNLFVLDLLGVYVIKKQTDILLGIGKAREAESAIGNYTGFGRFNLKKNSVAGLEFLLSRANINYHLGKYDSCRDLAERVLNFKLKTISTPVYLIGSAYNYLSMARFGKGDLPGAIQASQKANDFITGQKQADIIHNLATFQFYTADYDTALSNYKKAYKIFKRTGDLAGSANSLASMASVLVNIGKPEEAAEKFKQALNKQLKIKMLLDAAQTLSNLGVTYDILGKLNEAEKSYIKSIELRKQFQDLRGLGYCYHNLGSLLRKQNNFSEALIYLEKAISIRSKLGERLSLAYSYNSYGNLFLELKFFDKAKNIRESSGNLS